MEESEQPFLNQRAWRPVWAISQFLKRMALESSISMQPSLVVAAWPFSGVEVIAVLERDAFEAEVLRAFDGEEFFDDGGDDFGGGQVFAGKREVEDVALGAIEEPFAGGIAGGAEVFGPPALVGLELDDGIA